MGSIYILNFFVSYLMANILKHFRVQVLDILIPPGFVLWGPILPVFDLKLAQL